MSKFFIDSATHESETNSPTKLAYQENSDDIVLLSRTRNGTMRSKMAIEEINDITIKLGTKVMKRKTGKAKVNPKSPTKTVNLAKKKRVEDAGNLRQCDDRSQGTPKATDFLPVPPILLAGPRSARYKAKSSDRTLTGAKLEMEILS